MSLYACLHPLIRSAAYAFYRALGGYRVCGAEHIPRRGPALVACNHISLADPVAMLGASPRALHYMAAQELHDLPLLGPTIRFLQAFPVRRGQQDPEAVARCRALLRDGQAVVIFPEGRCSPDGRLGPLFPGVATLALREGCPVVPAVVHGTDRFLPLGARMVRRHPKTMSFGAPLDLGRLQAGVPVRQQVDQVLLRLQQALLDLGAVARDPEGAYQGSGRRFQTRS